MTSFPVINLAHSAHISEFRPFLVRGLILTIPAKDSCPLTQMAFHALHDLPALFSLHCFSVDHGISYRGIQFHHYISIVVSANSLKTEFSTVELVFSPHLSFRVTFYCGGAPSECGERPHF
jgi:hypothetical protein